MLYNGFKMHLRMACAGDFEWRTSPNRYVRCPLPPIPDRLIQLCQELGLQRPQTCLVNEYLPNTGKLGVHQDKDERSHAPIVSISIGCSADFICFTPEKQIIRLHNNDILVFGGEHRMMQHGVLRVLDDHMLQKRVCFTFREVE
jgi:alkylated DNA repair dioxygenase AlkB